MLEFWVTKKLIESKKSLRTMVRFLTKLVRNLTKLVRNLGIYPEVRIALTVEELTGKNCLNNFYFPSFIQF